MTRCELACGHTLFALPSEARQVAHGWAFCWPCSRFVAIASAVPLEPTAPRPTVRQRRRVLRKT